MIIEFRNLDESEKELLYNVGDNYTDELMVREIIASIDSETAMQLIVTLGPSIIAAIGQLVCKILDNKKSKSNCSEPTKIFMIFKNGLKIEINNIQDFNNVVNNGK